MIKGRYCFDLFSVRFEIEIMKMISFLHDQIKVQFILAIETNDEERLNRLLSQNGTEFIISDLQDTPLLLAVKLRK